MITGEGVDPANGLPYVDQVIPDGTTARRYLTAMTTPDNHKMKAMPGWFRATGIAPIARADWPEFQFLRVHKEIPILDQDGLGACVGYAATSAMMIIRARQGGTYVPLSACFLYSLINGGRDAGANGGDATDTLMQTGVATLAAAPGLFYRPAGYNAAAKSEAARFKLASVIPITSVEEAVTAVVYGFELLFDVQASGRYATDSKGVIAYCGRFTNHEQHAGEGFIVMPDGRAGLVGRNSWNTTFGGGSGVGGYGPIPPGMGIFTEDHIKSSQTTLAMKFAVGDPQDPNLPPPMS